LFAADVLRMYLRFARRCGLEARVAERQDEGSGLRSASVIVEGDCELPRREAGDHLVQRKTRSRRADRIHASVVSVRVLKLEDAGRAQLDRRQIRREAIRGTGAGGQHRNRRATAIRLTHIPTGINAYCDTRSQHQNEEQALRVLAARVAAAEVERRAEHRRRERRAQPEPLRTYDFVRGMTRERRSGAKTHKLEQVLDRLLELVPS